MSKRVLYSRPSEKKTEFEINDVYPGTYNTRKGRPHSPLMYLGTITDKNVNVGNDNIGRETYLVNCLKIGKC